MSERVLLTGSGGFLGHYLADELRRRRDVTLITAGRYGCDVHLDLGDPATIAAALATASPDYVLNSGAMSSMAQCQKEPTVALQVNGKSPQLLAAECGCRFLQVSTDLVFDGDEAPYAATAIPKPLSVYGMTKMAGEALPELGADDRDLLVVRVPLMFGKSVDGRRGATDMLRQGVGRRERQTLFTNEYRTPMHAADAARGLVDLLLDRTARGVRHVCGPERVSRWELAERFCAAVGIDAGAFRPGRSEDPRRPRDVSLAGDWVPDSTLDASLARS